MADSGQTRQRSAQSRDRDHQARRSPLSKRAESVSRNVGAIRDLVMRSVLAPVNAVMLTRRHMEEVLEDAVKRGRMTRDDAQQMLQSLLQRGAQQTDDFLSDLERLLARGSELEERPARSRGGQAKRRSRPRRPASNLPLSNYDELSAADVQDRLEGLTAAQLRKLRDYERRNANRKTVLDRIERKLR